MEPQKIDLRPRSKQYPEIDGPAARLVEVLERRGWSAPGVHVEFRTYALGTMVSEVTGEGWRVWYCRVQGGNAHHGEATLREGRGGALHADGAVMDVKTDHRGSKWTSTRGPLFGDEPPVSAASRKAPAIETVTITAPGLEPVTLTGEAFAKLGERVAQKQTQAAQRGRKRGAKKEPAAAPAQEPTTP